jgi:hypothetical protein
MWLLVLAILELVTMLVINLARDAINLLKGSRSQSADE